MPIRGMTHIKGCRHIMTQHQRLQFASLATQPDPLWSQLRPGCLQQKLKLVAALSICRSVSLSVERSVWLSQCCALSLFGPFQFVFSISISLCFSFFSLLTDIAPKFNVNVGLAHGKSSASTKSGSRMKSRIRRIARASDGRTGVSVSRWHYPVVCEALSALINEIRERNDIWWIYCWDYFTIPPRTASDTNRHSELLLFLHFCWLPLAFLYFFLFPSI